MREITTLAIDLAKAVFQLHGVDSRGVCVLRKQLRRAQLLSFLAQLPACLVAMEACGGAHDWGRRIGALGHRVKLIPPQYVKPFVRGDKTDRNDAQAICEAALRPDMPEVAVKSEEQQAMLAIHRLRELIDKQRKQLANQLRSLLAEFGEVMACGIPTLRRELPERLERVPALLRGVLREGYDRLIELQEHSDEHTRRIHELAHADPLCKRLMRERGIGAICASAYVASIGDPTRYRNGRQVSASIGIVPRKHGTGGKEMLLGISKRGDRYLRTLLIHGARAVIRHVPGKTDPLSLWLQQLIARRSVNCAAVALANKTARRLVGHLARRAAAAAACIAFHPTGELDTPRFAKTVNSADGTTGHSSTLRTCSLLRPSKAAPLTRSACADIHQGPRCESSHPHGRIYGRNLLVRRLFAVLAGGDGSIYGGSKKNIPVFLSPGKLPFPLAAALACWRASRWSAEIRKS